MKNTRQNAATIASNSDSLAKSEVCNQSLVFSFIDEKPCRPNLSKCMLFYMLGFILLHFPLSRQPPLGGSKRPLFSVCCLCKCCCVGITCLNLKAQRLTRYFAFSKVVIQKKQNLLQPSILLLRSYQTWKGIVD